ncbi:MAG: restriction endonuclease subunit S [Rhodocyclaceae bacterium]|nr:restriction endonuclease subunit S [Rhodocyclaceae bacterium]
MSEDEQSFVLPSGWEWVRLATTGNIFNGNSINSNEKEAKYRRNDGLPYIATKDVGYGLTPLDYENGVRIPDSEPSFKMAHVGAVFICAEGGSAGKKCGITDRNVYFGNKLFANEVFGGIPPRIILYHYLSPYFRDQFAAAMTGIIGGVSTAKFAAIPIPLPPLTEQHRIVAKVDELMALCDRLEARVGAGDTAHAKLVETLLGTLTQSTEADDLATNWQRISEHFDTLFTTESSLDALKQTILQLAVMGKLVPQDPNDEPAGALLKQIAKERVRLEAEGKIRKSIPVVPIPRSDQPYPIPANWEYARLQVLCSIITDGTHQTPRYTESGRPFLSAQNVKPFRFMPEYFRYVSEVDYQGYIRTTKPEFGDVLLTC